jgi:hypothetical protein
MVTELQHTTVKSIKVEFEERSATAWGGLSMVERLGIRLGFWKMLEENLPKRNGYSWYTVVKSSVMGLLTGAFGTYATQDLRNESSTLKMLGLDGAPEEATLFRALHGLGGNSVGAALRKVQDKILVKILDRCRSSSLLLEGFLPVFGDGSLLEGSDRREGTKTIDEKGQGLLWNAVFAGPLLCAEHLSGEGEGELSAQRKLLPEVVCEILEPCGLKSKALVLQDSLYGDDPHCSMLEDLSVHYIVGANKLRKTMETLDSLPEECWQNTGADRVGGWIESGVCECWLQCDRWEKKRLLIGRRWKKPGDMLWHYSGVLTTLTQSNNTVQSLMAKRSISFAQAIWWLYSQKQGCENYFKDVLIDLGMHHPPCQELQRNRGMFRLAALAHVLERAFDLLGCATPDRGQSQRQDGKPLKKRKPKITSLWRLRRHFFALPAEITRHARKVVVKILGCSEELRQEIEKIFHCIAHC